MATLVTNRVIENGTVNYEDLAEATIRILNPPGAVMSFAMSAAPVGWLPCNGAAINRTTYAPLFSAIGTTFGAGNGSTTFNLPDLRGEFIRGWAENRAVDTGRVFGSSQGHAFESHRHLVPNLTQYIGSRTGVTGNFSKNDGGINSEYTDFQGGTETRPRNIALFYCIKF